MKLKGRSSLCSVTRLRPRVILIVCGAGALAITAYTVIAPSGLPRLWQLQDEEKALAGEVARLRTENEALGQEVTVLQGGEPSSQAVLEKAAREELGWARGDEVIITGLPVAPAEAPPR